MTGKQNKYLYQGQINCPSCGHHEHAVMDSRPGVFMGINMIRRRRKCKACDHRFSTLEMREDQIPDLVENSLNEWAKE